MSTDPFLLGRVHNRKVIELPNYRQKWWQSYADVDAYVLTPRRHCKERSVGERIVMQGKFCVLSMQWQLYFNDILRALVQMLCFTIFATLPASCTNLVSADFMMKNCAWKRFVDDEIVPVESETFEGAACSLGITIMGAGTLATGSELSEPCAWSTVLQETSNVSKSMHRLR